VQVTQGRLVEVTPAFAWDEGEYDRTLESWPATAGTSAAKVWTSLTIYR
jgi:uncharacterized protein YhfF